VDSFPGPSGPSFKVSTEPGQDQCVSTPTVTRVR
jgi:hypothetical protein